MLYVEDMAYEITNCIWCGKKGFKNAEEVIDHIKTVHTKVN